MGRVGWDILTNATFFMQRRRTRRGLALLRAVIKKPHETNDRPQEVRHLPVLLGQARTIQPHGAVSID